MTCLAHVCSTFYAAWPGGRFRKGAEAAMKASPSVSLGRRHHDIAVPGMTGASGFTLQTKSVKNNVNIVFRAVLLLRI